MAPMVAEPAPSPAPDDGPRVRCTLSPPLTEVSALAQRGDGALVIATPGEVLLAGVAPGCALTVRARRATTGVVRLAADLARADRAWVADDVAVAGFDGDAIDVPVERLAGPVSALAARPAGGVLAVTGLGWLQLGFPGASGLGGGYRFLVWQPDHATPLAVLDGAILVREGEVLELVGVQPGSEVTTASRLALPAADVAHPAAGGAIVLASRGAPAEARRIQIDGLSASVVETIAIDAGELLAWSEIVDDVGYAAVRSGDGLAIVRVRTR